MNPISEVLTVLTEFKDAITAISILLGILGAVIGIINKFRNRVWGKLLRQWGKEKIFTCLKILEFLLQYMTIDEIQDLLLQFRKSQMLEEDMKEGVVSMKNIIKTKMDIPIIVASFKGNYINKKKAKIAELKNKKFLNRLKKDKDLQAKLDAVTNVILEKIKLQAITAKEKGKVDQVENLVKNIHSKKEKNREKRKAIERETEKAARKRIEEQKKRKGRQLHDKFKR